MRTCQEKFLRSRCVLAVASFGVGAGLCAAPGRAQRVPPAAEVLPSGMTITPTAARGSVLEKLHPGLPNHPDDDAGEAVTTARSPDKSTLLVLTSGYNQFYDAAGQREADASQEYVFVYDVSGGMPRKMQVLRVRNTYVGLAWHPEGREFYVSGGGDDNVHVFSQENGRWKESEQPIPLGHAEGLGIEVKPVAAGLAVSPSGTRLLVANYQNDSVSLVDIGARKKIAELDLRPGKNDPSKSGTPGGEYPYWIVWQSEARAYVSSERDREIVVLELGETPRAAGRIRLKGQPNRMLLNRARTRLYVAQHTSDRVAVVDTASGGIREEIYVTASGNIFANRKGWKGANPNSLELSPDGRFLFVTNGGANDVAVIALSRASAGDAADGDEDGAPASSRVAGLIPTGWYPNAVSVSGDGRMLYVANGFSNAGPNPMGCRKSNAVEPKAANRCRGSNQYVLQRMPAGLLAIPLPGRNELEALTRQVARNNHWIEASRSRLAAQKMKRLRGRIHHVIYVLKENRTYDQVLGDLGRGNGDPRLTLFPQPISPNHHRLARQFVTLDNFRASGNVSGDGWSWSTTAQIADPVAKNVPLNYAERGLSGDFWGQNRGVNVGVAEPAGRKDADSRTPDDPDVLPGTEDVSAPDSSEGEAGAGYLWDAARRAGLTVRNYGFFLDLARYSLPADNLAAIRPQQMPFLSKTVVAFPTKAALRDVTDPYYHGFDLRLADFYLFKEWEREFDEFERSGNLPNLEFVALPHDHLGKFAEALDGVNTVEAQMADNDYALGLLVERVSRSRYKDDTLIFVAEDDAQNGPDHVDAHRTVAFVLGGWVKRGAVVPRRYTTVNFLRTIEEVLGIEPLGLFDASLEPMDDVFRSQPADWSYTAIVPEVLRTTRLPLPPGKVAQESAGLGRRSAYVAPRHDAAYWEEKMSGLDFSRQDALDAARFNRVLWEGLKGKGAAYPATGVRRALSGRPAKF